MKLNVRSLIWLGLAVLFGLFAGGRWNVPLAVWLLPIFWVRFVRMNRPLPGLLLGALTNVVVGYVAMQGMTPMAPVEYIITTVIGGVLGFLPYLADRLMAPRLPGLVSTLVLPFLFTGLEYLNAFTNPFGTWGGVAYTQADNLALIQLVSVTGIWGITFLIGWLAAVVNWAWERAFEWPRVRSGVLLYAGVLLAVLGFGGARLALFPPAADTVRVAAITSPLHDEMSNQILAILLPQPGQTPGNWETVFAQAPAVNEDLLARTEQAARAGAKIVFWSEAMAVVPQEEEAALIARGQELARREQIYLGMALWTFMRRDLDPLPQEPVTINKVVLIEPSGAVAWEYRKSIPVPGAEEALTVKGDGVVRTLDTPYGRIGVVICFDADFPALVRPAGQSGVDILFVPGADWEAITPDHTQMAFFRGLENGFSVVRAAQNGLTAAADYQGRTLAWMDHFRTQDRTMLAHVPTRGVRTVYPFVGDLLAWLCLAGFVGTLVWAILRRGVRSET